MSWFGVHRVLRDASFEQPRALVVAVTAVAAASSAPPLPTAIGSATQSAAPSAAATPTPRTHSATPSHPASSTPSTAAYPTSTSVSVSVSASSGAGGQVQSFIRPGGRIAVDMGATSASLVSANPDAGWSMHVWTGAQWLRVDFEQGSTDSIFYVTWNGHPPMVQTWNP
jgi:hypothetical protein